MQSTRRVPFMVLALLVLAACGQGQQGEQAPVRAPEPVEQNYRWRAEAPSTVVSEGPPVVLRLSGGYAFAFMPQTPVASGDIVTARVAFQGAQGGVARFILQRHCDAANGEDNESQSHRLTGQPQIAEISHTFGQTYSCIRLSVMSGDGQPVDLTVTELTVAKTAAAVTDLRGAGDQ